MHTTGDKWIREPISTQKHSEADKPLQLGLLNAAHAALLRARPLRHIENEAQQLFIVRLD